MFNDPDIRGRGGGGDCCFEKQHILSFRPSKYLAFFARPVYAQVNTNIVSHNICERHTNVSRKRHTNIVSHKL